MFRFNGFTQKSSDAINLAIAKASALGHTYIGSEHLLLGLLSSEGSVAQIALSNKGIHSEVVAGLIVKNIGRGIQSTLSPGDITPSCKTILENAVKRAKTTGQPLIGTEHILTALMAEKDCVAVLLLTELNVDLSALQRTLNGVLGDQEAKNSRTQPKVPPKNNVKTPMLDRFSKDLIEMARKGELDPVLNRDQEITRVMGILSRRTKNNPCLIGEAGVGKTAIVEGLAQRIYEGKVPSVLLEKRLVSLDLTSVVAGTKYRGDFEERIKGILQEVSSAKNILLFIDEIHNIMGTGAAEGAIDAANILKPQLARGELQVIGATTFEEYRKHIEKDSALERRFQSVKVEEPSVPAAIEILGGLRERYETHHGLTITDEAIKAAVELSVRYMPDRFLPDKAIDMIDEACALVRLNGFSGEKGNQTTLQITQAKNRLGQLLVEGELQAAALLRQQIKLMETKEAMNDAENHDRHAITKEDIASVISNATGIEITTVSRVKADELMALEEQLSSWVIGQNDAVKAVSRAIKRGRVGLKDPKRPIGSFIFLGPTGVGKTELSVALSQVLFGSKDSLIRLDMSEYMEKHSISKLIGSPPGYVGFEEGGKLTEKIRRRPYSVVLFDEVEKAHPEVLTLLLQILEDGTLTDSTGRSCSFKNAVIIMTSNIGARHITENRSLGFSTDTTVLANTEVKKEVLKELKRIFTPELLNRIDETIIFKRLEKPDLIAITKQLIAGVSSRLSALGIAIEVSPALLDAIVEEGYQPNYGARPLRRTIQRMLEDNIADQLLQDQIQQGDLVICDYLDQKVVLKTKDTATC